MVPGAVGGGAEGLGEKDTPEDIGAIVAAAVQAKTVGHRIAVVGDQFVAAGVDGSHWCFHPGLKGITLLTHVKWSCAAVISEWLVLVVVGEGHGQLVG